MIAPAILVPALFCVASRRSGNGLGLSLVKAVADLHGVALQARDAEPGLQIVMRS